MLRSAIVAIALAFNAVDGQRPLPSPIPTKIIMLGTGTPNLSDERSGQSVAIVLGPPNHQFYVFDAGAGVLHRIDEALTRVYSDRPDLWHPGSEGDPIGYTFTALFITHLHIDHTLGLLELLFYHGPQRTEIAVDGFVYRDSSVTITAFPVRHDGLGGNFGYRVQTRDQTIVISGDTGPSEEVVKACNGCDVLIHEVYGVTATPPTPHFLNGHTDAYQLGELATRAKPKLLILNHQILHGLTPEPVLRQVQSKYSGRIAWGKDLAIY